MTVLTCTGPDFVPQCCAPLRTCALLTLYLLQWALLHTVACLKAVTCCVADAHPSARQWMAHYAPDLASFASHTNLELMNCLMSLAEIGSKSLELSGSRRKQHYLVSNHILDQEAVLTLLSCYKE